MITVTIKLSDELSKQVDRFLILSESKQVDVSGLSSRLKSLEDSTGQLTAEMKKPIPS